MEVRGASGKDETRVVLEDADGELEFTAFMTELRRDAQIRHAWAQTIHKFQVSERLEKKEGVDACVKNIVKKGFEQ